MEEIKIMIVEDESLIAEDLKVSLEKMGYTVPKVASTKEDAVRQAEKTKPDLILMDIVLRGKGTGIEAAAQIRAEFNIPVIYLTAYSDDEILERAKLTSPFGYLIKPFNSRELRSAIEVALYKHKLEKRMRSSEERLKILFDYTPQAIYITDLKGTFLDLNKAAEVISGYTKEEAVGKNFQELHLIIPEHIPRVLSVLAECALGRTTGPDELVIKHRDGTRYDIEIRTFPVSIDNKRLLLGVAHDITGYKELQKLIEQAKKEWEETFDIINDAITIHDRDFNIIRANKSAEAMLGLPFSRILTQKCYESYHGTGNPPDSCPSCRSLVTGEPSIAEIYEPHLNRYLEVKALPRYDEKGEIMGLIHVVRDITHKKKLENELREMSITDELTGLFNRRGFCALAEQQLKIAAREKVKIVMFYADLDGFKDINDMHGHKEGDNALIKTANILRASFRESDIIARIGGDEYVILVTEKPETSVEKLMSRLTKNVHTYNIHASGNYQLSLSVGTAHYDPERPSSLEELISRADKDMYEQKKRKRVVE